MKLSAEDGQAKPVAANATGFNPWKFTQFLDQIPRLRPRDFLKKHGDCARDDNGYTNPRAVRLGIYRPGGWYQ